MQVLFIRSHSPLPMLRDVLLSAWIRRYLSDWADSSLLGLKRLTRVVASAEAHRLLFISKPSDEQVLLSVRLADQRYLRDSMRLKCW